MYLEYRSLLLLMTNRFLRPHPIAPRRIRACWQLYRQAFAQFGRGNNGGHTAQFNFRTKAPLSSFTRTHPKNEKILVLKSVCFSVALVSISRSLHSQVYPRSRNVSSLPFLSRFACIQCSSSSLLCFSSLLMLVEI